MLALSDEALAHLAIAATAVPPAERGTWLATLAHKLDPVPKQVQRVPACPNPRPLRPASIRTARQREREARE